MAALYYKVCWVHSVTLVCHVCMCVLSGETKHRIYRTSVIPAFTGDVDVEFDPALGEIDNFALYGQFIFAEV